MQNEIINYEPQETQVSIYSDVILYEKYLKMAEGLSKTDIVPSNYKNKPEACMIALDVARRNGQAPLMVMQNLYVVNGKPSWSGQYCIAMVRANFSNVQVIWLRDKENNNIIGCKVTAVDKNGNHRVGSSVTFEMAKKEGWYNKSGSKWQTMPEQMLQYRAFTFFARVYCPEKLLGIMDEYENEDIRPAQSSSTKNLNNKLSAIAEEIIDVEIAKEE